jgi:hypothetical protein
VNGRHKLSCTLSGGPLSANQVRQMVKRRAARAGIDKRPGDCTTQYDTTRHETPCDRRHTDVLTKRLAKTSGSGQTRRSPAIHNGVSEGTRTPDTQDHKLSDPRYFLL